MRKSLPLLSLLSGAVLSATSVFSQQADRFAYSITDGQNQANNWVQLRIMNLETGVYSEPLLNGLSDQQVVFDAFTKKRITDLSVNKMGFNEQPAFNSGVAALAYDSRHARLYYTPMFIDQLRYYDLKTQQVYYVTIPFTGKPVKTTDQGNIVTRMVIASDGNGYAMTNDATQLMRFSTGKKPAITDLGSIVDDPANKNVSIHNSCSSYGGDMIADDDGNLYVFSARNHVFRINIESRIATHLGMVSGLPNGFTINGAAVDANNKVVVASATDASALYSVDTKSWAATPVAAAGTLWHASDLANGNLLASGNKKTTETVELSRNQPVAADDAAAGSVSIFPNPVTNNQFTLRFGQLQAGNYTIQVTDVMGRQLLQQAVAVNTENQVQKIKLGSSASKGVYLIKVLDGSNNTAFSSKIVVQ
ncbi:MAG: T9SS type A sorting domain-containing protein [Chitinophagaceae bacterium]